MANFASLRGPVGLNRVYAKVPAGPLNIGTWLDSIKHGRTFATNGPLLGFSLGGKQPGDEISLPAGENKVKFTAWLRSFVPIDHLQVICNGEVVRDLKLNGDREAADVEGHNSDFAQWLVPAAGLERQGRASCAGHVSLCDDQPDLCDGRRVRTRRPTEDAAYFIAWIDRMIDAAKSNQDWNTEAEKAAVLEMLSSARKVYAEK